jgi:hypothetical protein
MFANKKGSARRAAIVAASFVFALSTAGAGAYVAFADESTPVSAVPVAPAAALPADLENAFWVCDFVGTTYGVSAAPVALCSEVTTALQEQKFGGDFAQFLEWWGQNKTVEHSKLAAVQPVRQSVR